MALPFDLRALAASAGTFDDQLDRGARGACGTPARPSRAITLPAGVIAGVQARNVDAFRELVQSTYVPLTRFARTILGTQDEAEDIVQDVFTALWDRAAQWRPSGDPVAYLFGSVRNHALNELRRRERELRRARQAGEPAPPPDAAPDAPGDALQQLVEAETDAARVRMVAAVLATCTERQRTVYDLRYRRGLTAPAIAEVLGITVKSAEQLVSRVTHLVLDRLRAEIERTR